MEIIFKMVELLKEMRQLIFWKFVKNLLKICKKFIELLLKKMFAPMFRRGVNVTIKGAKSS